MGRTWAQYGHVTYPLHDHIPGLGRFKIQIPRRDTINAASSGILLPAPYDGTLFHTVAVDALVVAMHVNTCSPTNLPPIPSV